MRRGLGQIALLGFFASAAVNVAAVFGAEILTHGFWVLAGFIGILVPFIAAILVLRRIGWDGKPRSILGLLPRWASTVLVLVVIYAGVNFLVLFLKTYGEGSPAIDGQRYVLRDGSRFVREITEAEYRSLRAVQTRSLSAHHMVFYFFSFAVLLLIQEKHPRGIGSRT